MSQLDALRLSENIRQRMVDFALDDNFVRDSKLSDICRRIWDGSPSDGGLISDLWVEGAFPSKASPHTLDSLVSAGKFDPRLRDVLNKPEAMPAERRLYTHQYEAIERTQTNDGDERPSIVVTAGTGAGKTESFLLPILNDLYQNPSEDKRGAKCLILYPMNALVNDQVDRLYGWLKGQDQVTLFHFTSETPENNRIAKRQGVPEWEPCRMRTRRQARGLEDRHGKSIENGPTPDIVITNYSMLEYMLCRPQDAAFFGPSLRTIVLDEAHLYTGTLAAEITLLLRRLMLRCGVDSKNVLQFATSATLGDGNLDDLRGFASQVFSKPSDLVHVIKGELTKAEMLAPDPPNGEPTPKAIVQAEWPDSATVVENSDGSPGLATIDEVPYGKLRASLSSLVSGELLADLDPNEHQTARILHDTLSASPLIHKTQDILWNRKHVPLEELGTELFGVASDDSTDAAATLLRLAASARLEPGSYPLVPHRLHVLTRPADGLTVCLNQNCSCPADLRLDQLGAVSAGHHEVCEYCECSTLSLYRCENCGEWLLAGREKDWSLIPEARKSHDTKLLSITRSATSGDTIYYIDPATGEMRGSSEYHVALTETSVCPNCDEVRDFIRPFLSATPLTLSLATETLLSEMPEFPAAGTGINAWLPAGGRRLLAFSDSRREAARLGILLTNQHEQQLVRSAILNVIETSQIGDSVALEFRRNQIAQWKDRLNEPDLNPIERRILEGQLKQFTEELTQLTAGGSIEHWAEQLEKHESVSQLLDRPSSDSHTARNWKQLKWEDNAKAIKNQIELLLGKEFARVTARTPGRDTTLEALGLVEVTYPGIDTLECPPQFLGTLPTESMRQPIRENWTYIVASLCDTLRADGAITLGNEIDEEYDFDRVPIGFWASAENNDGPRLARFVGATRRQQRVRFAEEILKRCGFTDNASIELKAQEFLRTCFNQLLEAAQAGHLSWVESDNRQVGGGGGSVPSIRLVFNKLGLRRPSNPFRCKVTGRAWPRSILGCAPNTGSYGTLEPATHEQLNEDLRLGRRRREYRDSPIFKMGLWSEEHSAQLDPRENRRLQDLFKSGVRNILSATTTLELGIDIGGLNGVLMSNVPPGKANYLQRAGRAGRRADGSSIVATFARSRPFDREVFGRIGDYLDQPLRKPMVFLDRERVVRRHLNSFLLNEFFSPATSQSYTGAMDAFGNMGDICGVQRVPHWSLGSPKPELEQENPRPTSELFLEFLERVKAREHEYRPRVATLLSGTVIEDSPSDSWESLIQYAAEQFTQAVEEWRSEYYPILDAWTEIQDRQQSAERRQAAALRYQSRALYELTVIEALADHQFLPHYGFPIGVQKLRVISPDEKQANNMREEDQYRLERNSLLALREYVPGSQLLVGGKLVTSHGLLKHWTGAEIDNYIGYRGLYTWCVNDHFYYWNTPDTEIRCPICGEQAEKTPTRFMFPKHGFSGAAWDPPKWSTNTEIVGEPQTAAETFIYDIEPIRENFGGIRNLSAYYKEDGELLVYNSGERELGFAICLQCGYADSEREMGEGRMDLPLGFERHAPLSATNPNRICWAANTAPVIRNETLAAREVTDVLMIDFSECLSPEMRRDTALVTTLGYALQRAAAYVLQLDGREIGVLSAPAGDMGLGLGALLYDNVPGGAGHVRELLEIGRDWLEEARRTLWVDNRHDQRCISACLDCLLSFDTQSASFKGLLDRRHALSELTTLLDSNS